MSAQEALPSHETSHVGSEADQGDQIAECHDAAYVEKGVP